MHCPAVTLLDTHNTEIKKTQTVPLAGAERRKNALGHKLLSIPNVPGRLHQQKVVVVWCSYVRVAVDSPEGSLLWYATDFRQMLLTVGYPCC